MVQEDLIEVNYFIPTTSFKEIPGIKPKQEDWKKGATKEVEVQGVKEVPYIRIKWVPTVPNCHLAMTIALCIKSKLNTHL